MENKNNTNNTTTRSCKNCKNRFGSLGCDYCIDYEMATTEEEYIESAKGCKMYEESKPDCFNEDGGSGYL